MLHSRNPLRHPDSILGNLPSKTYHRLAGKKVSVSTVMFQLGGFILIMMLTNGLSGFVGTRKGALMSRMVEHLNGLLFLKSLRVKYSDAESGNAKQILYKAYNGTKSCRNVVSTSIEFMVKLLCFLLYSTVLSTLNPWLILILIGMSALNYLIGMHQLKVDRKSISFITSSIECSIIDL